MNQPTQLFVKIDNKSNSIVVNSNSTIKDVFEKILKLPSLHNAVTLDELRVIFGTTELQYKDGQTLDDFDIINGSTLYVVMRLKGGSDQMNAYLKQKTELSPRHPFVTISYEPDMITLDDDPNEKRAKLQCGHVISVESMTTYARDIIQKGGFQFICPYISPTGIKCNAEWLYVIVRHVAALSLQEMEKIETQLGNNYLLLANGIQQCPGCKIFCSRPNNSNRMQCQICTSKANNVPFEFCWSCLRQWNGDGNRTCGNSDCDGADPRAKFLSFSSTKQIGKVMNVPLFRACPHCGMLIEHTDACKHMVCRACKKSFCFICLQPQLPDGKWLCDGPFDSCPVAPVQKNFPGV